MMCSNCGKETENFLTIQRSLESSPELICLTCQTAKLPEATKLIEADSQIEELQELKDRLQRLMRNSSPDSANLPAGLGAVVFTPEKAMQSLNAFLENSMKDRENILDTMTRDEQVQAQLDSAVEREKYEEAEVLKREMERRRNTR